MPTSARSVELGNYAEVKNSDIGAGTKSHHFSYLGDADVGEKVNIGAGSITANYDGVNKHRTRIGKGAFIGSDTILRAPVSVGEGAFTGAASLVTRDVPDGKMVAGRAGPHPRPPSHAPDEPPADRPARGAGADQPAGGRPGPLMGALSSRLVVIAILIARQRRLRGGRDRARDRPPQPPPPAQRRGRRARQAGRRA